MLRPRVVMEGCSRSKKVEAVYLGINSAEQFLVNANMCEKKELSYAQLVSSRTYQLCVPETCIQSENAHLKLVLLDSSVAIRVTIKQTLCSTNTSLDVAECSLAIKSCPPVHRVRCDCKKVWKL